MKAGNGFAIIKGFDPDIIIALRIIHLCADKLVET
jgi:hypothetical protein